MGQNVKDAVYFTFSNKIFIFYWNVIGGVQKLRLMPMATKLGNQISEVPKLEKLAEQILPGVFAKLMALFCSQF